MVSDARTRRVPGTRRERAAAARRGEQTLVKKRMEAIFLLFLDAIAGAITARTRAIIVNTPHNPTGRIYPPATLERLAALWSEYRGRMDG